MHCTTALEVLSALHNWWIDFPVVATSIQQAFTRDCVVTNLKKEHTDIYILLFAFAWMIWTLRNAIIFHNKTKNTTALVSEVKALPSIG